MSELNGAAGPRRVLLSAYACAPVDEPEAAAGWAFAVAAAQRHEVWVITRPRFRVAVESALDDSPELAQRLHVEFLDLPGWVTSLKSTSLDIYWYYLGWQSAFRRRASTLHAQVGFDVVHHVTFANDWLPCGAAKLLEIPLVWGPVGGASQVPLWRMRRWLGVRGLATELLRILVTGACRRFWGDPAAARASVVVAQNDGVAHRFARAGHVVVQPNAALDAVVAPAPCGGLEPGRHRAVFVGRLTAWKGPRLALEALAHPLCADWLLSVYGDGHQRGALERLSRELGVADRVVFLGHRPRAEVLAAYLEADALLFPSMHDQAGWVAAEASSAGCPVVCLPLGGVPLLAGPNGFVASLEGDIVSNLAERLRAAATEGGQPHTQWSRDRLPALVADWYAWAVV